MTQTDGGGSAPRIGVVVINFNDAENTRKCLSSLRTLSHPNVEVFCVDNGSRDGSADVLISEFDDVRFIRSERNLGFAGGMNLGIRAAMADRCDFVFCFNNDAVVDDRDLLGKLLKPFEEDDRMGVTSPIEYDANGTKARYPRCTSGAKYEIDVTGAAFLVPTKVLRETGLFDEGFFLYYEDSDLFVRIQRSGYRLMTVHDGRFLHVGCSTTSGQSRLVMYLDTRNRIVWFARHWGAREFVGGVIKLHVKRMPRYLLEFCERGDRLMLSAYLRGLIDGLRLMPRARSPDGLPPFDAERWLSRP